MPIQCDLCQRWFHGKCEKFKRLDWSTLGKSTLNWYCSICKFDIFPFNKLDNDELAEYVTGISSELDILRKNVSFYKGAYVCFYLCTNETKFETQIL